MKSIAIILGLIVALVIGGGVGYYSGKASGDTGAKNEELQESITMMKEQSSRIQKMGEMMKSGGVVMQEMGMKYNDEGVVMQGKDLETIATKYMDENKKSENSGSMKPMMGN